jgi:hypothetical protein
MDRIDNLAAEISRLSSEISALGTKASSVVAASRWIALVTILLGIVAFALTYWSYKIGEEKSSKQNERDNLRQQHTDIRIAEAHAIASAADQQRLLLEASMLERTILPGGDFTAALASFSPIQAEIEFLDGDKECRNAAGQIGKLLESANWKVLSLAPNSRVLPLIRVRTGFVGIPNEKKERGRKAGRALVDVLNQQNATTEYGPPTSSRLPEDRILVSVGKRIDITSERISKHFNRIWGLPDREEINRKWKEMEEESTRRINNLENEIAAMKQSNPTNSK